MTFGELKVTRGKLMRIAGLLAVTTAVAGCSSDATRLQDSFYTGAIPQSAPQQPAYAQAPQQKILHYQSRSARYPYRANRHNQ